VNTPPVVFAGIFDMNDKPKDNGNYAGTISGYISYGANLVTQWIGKLQSIAPAVRRVAVIYDENTHKNDPHHPHRGNRPTPKAIFDKIMHNPRPVALDVDSPTLDTDIRDFKGGQNDCGLVVVSGTLAGTTRQNIIALASRHSLPAIYPNRCYVTAGGLLSYGA